MSVLLEIFFYNRILSLVTPNRHANCAPVTLTSARSYALRSTSETSSQTSARIPLHPRTQLTVQRSTLIVSDRGV